MKRRQHGIPRGILKFFSDSDKRTFQLIKKSKKIVNNKTSNVMVQTKLYETEGLPSNLIEDKLAERENLLIPFIGKLISYTEKLYNSQSSCEIIIENILNDIEEFLLFYYRSTGLFDYYKGFHNNHEIQMEAFRQLIDREYILNLGKTLKEGYDFCIIVDKKERFILSDTYLVTVSTQFKSTGFVPNNIIGLKDTMVLIPLSSKFYFIAFNGKKPTYLKKDKFCTLNTKEVNKINGLIGESAYNICCSKDINSLRILIKSLKFKGSDIIFYNVSDDHTFNEDIIKNGTISKYILLKSEVFFYEEDKDKSKRDNFRGKKNPSEALDKICINPNLITEIPYILVEQKYTDLTNKEKELFNEGRDFLENFIGH